LGAISIFSVGEMLSSPKFSEFIGNFAPHDKKAMYIGFSQIPLAIGWSLEGKLGPALYEHFASKDRFSRDLLLERIHSGQVKLPGSDTLAALAESLKSTPDMVASVANGSAVAKIPQGEAFTWLVKLTGGDPKALTDVMYQSHNVGAVWYIMGGIGIATAISIWIYGEWIRKLRTT
jgi:hypothetical protein